MNSAAKDISLDELVERDCLTARAMNICKYNRLVTLKQILDFYQLNGSFMNLRNCGKKTHDEITSLCEKYYEELLDFEVKDHEHYITIINELNPLKRAALNRHVEYLVSNLNSRAQNGIRNISSTGSIKEILDTIYELDFHFKKLPNIGSGTVEELEIFKTTISNFLIFLKTLPDAGLSKEYAKLVVKTTFYNLPDNFDSEFESVFEVNGKVKLFRLLSLITDSRRLFTKNERRVFLSIFTNNYGLNESLDSIADELNLSRERIRQIKALLQKNIENHFNFITNFIKDDFVSFDVEIVNSYKIIDDSVIEKINQEEGVNYNKLFCSIIYGVLFMKSHVVLGADTIYNGKNKIGKESQYKCCYLISRNLVDVFEFDLFVENIKLQLDERITTAYTLHFEGFLLQFLKDNKKHFLNEIVPLCEAIILNEFDMIVSSDNYLVFERNTKKPLSEYAFEILEAHGIKMQVEEIYIAIKLKYPDLETTEQSVRAAVQREKKMFIYFGRSSTYALKKWEKEHENIKGGTIRDIVEDYLLKEDTPKHISEILKFVQRFRSTNERSLMTNIVLEEDNRFLFFDGDFVGLKGRTYGFETLAFKRVTGSHFVTKMLAKLNGLDIEKVVEYYVNKYGYAPVQVRFILEKKLAGGYIQITPDNKLKT